MIKYILTSFIVVTNLSLYCSEKNTAKDAKAQAEKAKASQAVQAAVASANISAAGSKKVAVPQCEERNVWNCDICGTKHRGRTVEKCKAKFFAGKP